MSRSNTAALEADGEEDLNPIESLIEGVRVSMSNLFSPDGEKKKPQTKKKKKNKVVASTPVNQTIRASAYMDSERQSRASPPKTWEFAGAMASASAGLPPQPVAQDPLETEPAVDWNGSLPPLTTSTKTNVGRKASITRIGASVAHHLMRAASLNGMVTPDDPSLMGMKLANDSDEVPLEPLPKN